MRARASVWLMLLAVSGSLAWDYPASPDVLMFLLFAKLEGKSYDWEHPTWPMLSPGIDPAVSVDCRTLTLLQPGPWHAVLKAVDMSGRQSAPSNEITFYWSFQHGCTATPMGPIIPPPLSRPILPAPPIVPPHALRPPPPWPSPPGLPPAAPGLCRGWDIWAGACR